MSHGLNSRQLEKLKKLQAVESQLVKFSFPRSSSRLPGQAELHNLQQSFVPVVPNPRSRNCNRCKTVYPVSSPSYGGTCKYHEYRPREGKHRCCGRSRGGTPCTTSKRHVTADVDPNQLTGFVNTSVSGRRGSLMVVALDCEMVYTEAGLEVAALSMVDVQGNVVYETKVVPDTTVVDYNTAHSMLSHSDLLGVTTRLADVHQRLLGILGPDTVLVGHGLHEDLLRLRVVHDVVVDTSIVYPHPKGFPVRNSLYFLTNKFLCMHHLPRGALKCRKDAQDSMRLVTRLL